MRSRTILHAVVVSFLACAAAFAQLPGTPAGGAEPVWYGLETPAASPEGAAAPAPPAGVWRASQATRPGPEAAPVPPQMSGENLLSDIRAVVDIAEASRLRGDVVWGRILGSEEEMATVRYMDRAFRSAGLKVETDEFPLPEGGRLTGYSLLLASSSASGAPWPEIALPHAFPARAFPLTGELVWVGQGAEADFAGRDVRDRIVVIQSVVRDSVSQHTGFTAVSNASQAGAAGAIVILNAPVGGRAFKSWPLWGQTRQGFGIATVTGPSAQFLSRLFASAKRPVTVRTEIARETLTNRKSANVFGFLPGRTDEYVLVTAHTDSFFGGATDNASGIAGVLALARYFTRPGAPKLNRTLVFVGTGGHHLYSPGVEQIIKTRRGMMERTAFVLNPEHFGSKDFRLGASPDTWTGVERPYAISVTSRSPELIRIVTDAIDDHGLRTFRFTAHNAFGDPLRFQTSGVPVIDIIGSPSVYHTDLDTPDVLSPEALEAMVQALAQVIEQSDGLTWDALEKGALPRPPLGDGGLPDRYIP